MKKKYQAKQNEIPKVEEPKLTYGSDIDAELPGHDCSKKSKVMEGTVSVDEYFDELISLVHSDYANF